jgi:chaperonin GroES
MKFRPSGDAMLVEDHDTGETTESGLVVPESAQKPYIYGTVLAVGPGRRNESGDRVEHDYWVGQKVMYHRHRGSQIEIEGEELRMIVPADVVGYEDGS